MINEDIEIVKINITANDIPETFSIPRYPTVYWVPFSTKLPILYSGKMDLETLIRFILKMKGRGEKAGLLHEIKVDVHSPGDSVETQVNSVADKINFFEVNIIFFSFCFFISIILIFSTFSQFFLLLQIKYFCYNWCFRVSRCKTRRRLLLIRGRKRDTGVSLFKTACYVNLHISYC